MKPDDLVLLRGWINHIEWAQLDSQLPEAGASSRKRVKDLRRQLAMKARFYGKSEHVELWRGERGHTETWARLALMAILKRSVIWKKRPQQLSGAGARSGAIRRPVVSGTGVCGFAPKAKTLADVVDLLEAVFAGDNLGL